MNQWDPEHAVPPDQAAALIGGQFPELAGAPVELLAVGWDNTVYLAGGWVFRFPRRTIALAGVRREIGVLPRLAPRLPLPIPVPELIGRPAGGYPWRFWGARPVPGIELAEAGPPGDGWTRAAAQLGGFLKALHDPGTAAEFGTLLPYDPMGRADTARRASMTAERLPKLAGRGLWEPVGEVGDLLARADGLTLPDGPGVISHGDLHQRHLMVHPDGSAAGVIDWGDLCMADPSNDLSLAYSAFDPPARAAFFAAYGSITPEQEIRARVLAAHLCALLAEWAADTGHDRVLKAALNGLRRSAL